MANIKLDTSNTLFQLAVELVNQSSRNIFLTGKAGTGKTTFLKYIRENCPKQMAVVAPTGVAAINAGGVTIHSFFQLPLSPFVPETRGFTKTNEEVISRHSLVNRLKFTKEKIKLLQQLELLIIDEVSMVRCDIMDAIDTVLRHVRRRPHDRFGGVQMLFIGDMFQLPPVIKDAEWKLLSGFYNAPYFFDSAVIKEELPVYIEFNKIYRQSEERFIRVLNQVRNNELDEEGVAILESRYQPGFRRQTHEGYIILATHNEMARNINMTELTKLNNPVLTYKADLEGEFTENAYPADELLQLKVGAQVMFIKNDSERGKRYFNGKIGIVTKLAPDEILVQCKDEPEPIEVNREKWENIRYTLNPASRIMEPQVLGSFTQYPLRLAWAITIHKSQGLTFEKAIIDAGEAFAPGQVYVALSRCTNLEGMVLQSKVRPGSLYTDPRIVEFSRNSASSPQLQLELKEARKNYQLKLLLSLFDFQLAINSIKEVKEYLIEHESSFNIETIGWLDSLFEKLQALQAMASRFHIWIEEQFRLPVPPEENTALRERTSKATEHFVKELSMLIELLKQSPAVTDSRLHAKEYNDGIREVFAELSNKKFIFQGFNSDFNVEEWHKQKKSFILPSFSVNAYAGVSQEKTESPHPALYQRLRKLRDAICARKDMPIYIVAGSKTIDEMARYLPQTLAELRKIIGFGDAKIEQYGQQFLDIILEYSKENNLVSLIHEKSAKKEKKERKESTETKKLKPDTKAESLKLYQQGMTAAEIAKARSLTVQTIEGHLSHYVSIGEISIDGLLSREKFLLIESVIKNFPKGPLSSIKERLGNDIEFSEIKLALAWQEFQNSLQQSE